MSNEIQGYWAYAAGIINSPWLRGYLEALVELERERVVRKKKKELCQGMYGDTVSHITRRWMYKSKRVRKMERQRELGMI